MSISTAVFVAAGKGRRMGKAISKRVLPLCGRKFLRIRLKNLKKRRVFGISFW